MPMTSAAGQSLMVTFQPRRWQYFMYILKSMKVQSWASKPPCPGLMVTIASPWSNSPVNQLASSSSSMARDRRSAVAAASSRSAAASGSSPISSASSNAARASESSPRAVSTAAISSLARAISSIVARAASASSQKPGATLLASSSVTRVRFSSKWRYDSTSPSRSANASNSAGVTSRVSAINDSCRGST